MHNTNNLAYLRIAHKFIKIQQKTVKRKMSFLTIVTPHCPAKNPRQDSSGHKKKNPAKKKSNRITRHNKNNQLPEYLPLYRPQYKKKKKEILFGYYAAALYIYNSLNGAVAQFG